MSVMPEGRVHAPLSEADACRIAREIYGLAVSARPLPGEYDDNFHLMAGSGEQFVLKVMHPAREHALVDLQCRALEHLERHAPSLRLPRVRTARGGDAIVSVPGPSGGARLVWLLGYVPGNTLASARPRTSELLASLGLLLGRMDGALVSFEHPAAHRQIKWDLSRAGWIRERLGHVAEASRRARIEAILARYDSEVVPVLARLRRSVIHGDANDYNVLVGDAHAWPREAVSVIDFGDMHHTVTVAEPAVAAAYALLGQTDPLASVAHVVGGYHAALSLTDEELAVLFPLVETRLAVSVVNSAWRRTLHPDDPYVTISEAPACEALDRLARLHPRFAHATLRHACGLAPLTRGPSVARWLAEAGRSTAPVVDPDPRTAPSLVFDLSVGSLLLGADPGNVETAALTPLLFGAMERSSVRLGIGRYDEPRALYSGPAYATTEQPTDERRTVHLGIDLFVAAGTPVCAPLDGVVHLVARNAAPKDYGPLIILRHETGGEPVFTLFGHLGEDALRLSPGQSVRRGERIASVGAPPSNGDWPSHLHFQVILDLLDLHADFPGVALPSQRAVWTALSPDPNVLLRIPAERFPAREPSSDETRQARHAVLGPNLSVSYSRPLKIVRGFAQYLYDDEGRAYLDVYNNVPLVGHSHPRVVAAAQAQLALLNTNTRYLHDNVVRYAERLTALLPDALSVCYIVNSGSEANELALRLSRATTAHQDVIVLEHAYHGHTGGLIDVSPYKFDGPGGRGRRPWVHVAPLPDTYRGRYRREDPAAGPKYAQHVADIVEGLRAAGGGPAVFLAETLPSVAGQIVLPPRYLAEAYRAVRAAGGVCIADEVQVGFGRLGDAFWGFEQQQVVPDIVVLGKPIGNAFPLAAVITTRAIASTFDNGMEFFSTFGGNPVSCAVGLAVLDVLRDERLQQNAARVGARLIAGLRDLAKRHALVGDVRGSGLFLGVELVQDRETRAPAPRQSGYIVDRLRERGVLAGTDGPFHNVIKIRPPLVVRAADAELFVTILDETLSEDAAQP
jgi:4-aminobutyrate aminotransferase-like enzyme/Ser/Thr protein kinase RdoA (MazF antagonist)